MALRSYHNHSVFCDGKNTIEEMAISANEMGLVEIATNWNKVTLAQEKDACSHFHGAAV